jgi:hypothetical protein
MDSVPQPPFDAYTRETIDAAIYKVLTQFHKQLAIFTENLPNVLGRVGLPGETAPGLPPPPKQPNTLLQVLGAYAAESFDEEFAFYPKRSAHISAWKKSIAERVEKRVINHAMQVGRGIGGNIFSRGLEYHLSEQRMRQGIQEALASRIAPIENIEIQVSDKLIPNDSTGAPAAAPPLILPFKDHLRRCLDDSRWTVEKCAEEMEIDARSIYRHLSGTRPRKRQIAKYEKLFSETLKCQVTFSLPVQTSGKRQGKSNGR